MVIFGTILLLSSLLRQAFLMKSIIISFTIEYPEIGQATAIWQSLTLSIRNLYRENICPLANLTTISVMISEPLIPNKHALSNKAVSTQYPLS